MTNQVMNNGAAGGHGVRRSAQNRKASKDSKKNMAKLGMAVSMGTLVATGLMPNKKTKNLHVLSGIALVGFSLWHYSLYQPTTKTNR